MVLSSYLYVFFFFGGVVVVVVYTAFDIMF